MFYVLYITYISIYLVSLMHVLYIHINVHVYHMPMEFARPNTHELLPLHSVRNLCQYLLCGRRGGHKSHACYACHFSIVAVTPQKKCAWGIQEPTCCGRKEPLAAWGTERNSVVLTLTSVQPQSQQEPRISCSPGFIPTYSARFCVDERATVLLIRLYSTHLPITPG